MLGSIDGDQRTQNIDFTAASFVKPEQFLRECFSHPHRATVSHPPEKETTDAVSFEWML